MAKKLLKRVKSDPVLFVSLLLAAVSAFFVPPSEKYIDYIDFRVLALLLSLMLVVAGLKKAGAFAIVTGALLKMVKSVRALAAVLIGVCFFSSMLVTNDVSLITFVPLAVMILSETGETKMLIPVIVLQTIAANLGSGLTPMGNPQNLYLYSLSGMTAARFLSVMALPTAVSLVLLIVSLLFIKNRPVASPEAASGETDIRRMLLWCALFIVCLLAVLRVLHYALALAAVLLAVVFDRGLLKRADYSLLLTFIFFFIFIGNVKNIPSVSAALSSLVVGRELTMGILLSQVISNVPAAMLLSGFTESYAPLLLGVNIGGLGTLIASMASMISYKLYAKTQNAQTGRYIAVFTAANIAFLAILWAVAALAG